MKQLISVVIPAAGLSSRFKDRDSPTQSKLYAKLGGSPLISRVLSAFDSLPNVSELIVAVKAGEEKRFKNTILSGMRLQTPVRLVRGGRTRAESVWNALKRVSKKAKYVCVHDGARPLVQASWCRSLLRELNGCDGVVLGRETVPTIKILEGNGSGNITETLDRRRLFEAETPQVFPKDTLLNAYRILGKRALEMTDDASLVEAAGGTVKAVFHSGSNLKITTYEDLLMAEKIAGGNSLNRFGFGYDRHRLVLGRPFVLGGVRIPSLSGPVGHSDGDPLLHAITDGILGAVGAGDIGDFFSNRNPRWQSAKSEMFLKKAVELAAKKGFHPAQVDTTVILDEPKLGAWKKKIAARIAKLLSLKSDQVNIKAKTSEGVGPEAKSQSVSVQALVVLISK